MKHSQPIFDYVLERVFGVFLSAPAALQLRLDRVATSITITSQGLQFSLPQLYALAALESKHAQTEAQTETETQTETGTQTGAGANSKTQSYASFRRCLYGQQTQVALRALGGEVVIADNHQHVDKSIYRLQALAH